MKLYYVIEDIDSRDFWSKLDKKFRGINYAEKFQSIQQLLNFANTNNIGLFKITTIYNTDAK